MNKPAAASSPAPRWGPAWLALLPALPFTGLFGVLGLREVRFFPALTRQLMIVFALSQLVPALLSPDPVLATGMAVLRTLLVVGLIGAGGLLNPAHSRWIGVGVFVTILLAAAATLVQGSDLYVGRLQHPLFTSVTFGVLAAWGVWLAAFGPGGPLWRAVLGVSSVAAVVLSGSRSALLATAVGLVAAGVLQASRRPRRGALLAGVAVTALGALALLTFGRQLAPVAHLLQLDANGRQVIWTNSLAVQHSAPWTGVGPYRLGAALAIPGDCQFLPTQSPTKQGCPAWFERLGSPWLVAHNGPLHGLVEGGPAGLAGTVILIAFALVTAVSRRDPLAVAALTGLLMTNVNDNTWLVPSPGIGELFWVCVGGQLRHLELRGDRPSRVLGLRTAAVGSAAVLVMSVPLLLLLRGTAQPAPGLHFFFAPPSAAAKGYRVMADLDLPDGTYLAAVNSCLGGTCRPLTSAPIRAADRHAWLDWTDLQLADAPVQTLQLLVFSMKPDILRPLGEYRWTVQVQP